MMGRKKKHPILTGVLILFALLIVIGALGSKDSKSETAKVEEPAPVEASAEETVPVEEVAEEQTVAEEPSEEPAVAEDSAEDVTEEVAPAEEEKTEFGVGDTVTQNDITVTLLGVTENKGSAYNKPASGNVYVLCEFEIENNKSSDINVSSLINFECYCDDYSTTLSLGALIERGSKNQLDGSVAAGKKMNGVIGYEVPADWNVLEIRYTPSGFFAKEFIFVVNK